MVQSSVWMVSIGLLVMGVNAAVGQTYPSKPIRMLTSDPGSGGDFTTRMIAQGISGPLGQQIIVENRPSGIIVGDQVAKAPADGYTLLVTGSSFWLTPLMQDNVPYDPVRDFLPVTLVMMSPLLLAVHPSVPVKSTRELIALAKSRPGALNYGSAGSGNAAHLAAELFKSMAGVKIVRIPYKGSGSAVTALVSGEVQLIFSTAAAVSPHVKSGRLRALAVTSPQPSALAPGLPTVAASGLNGYEWVSPFGVFAPAKTPVTAIRRLNQEIVLMLGKAEVKQKFLDFGTETVGSSPEEFASKVQAEVVRVGKLIKEAGIKAE